MLYLSVIFPFIAYLLPIKDKRIKLLISIAPAVYIIAFRFGLGTDYFSYEYLYNNHNISTFSIAMSDQARSMELVFRFLIYIFKSLGFSFQVFVAFISFLIYGLFLKWIYDSEEDLALSIMLYNGMFFVVWTLGALRQGVVLALGTYLIFNKNDKFGFWKSFILVLILGQVHASAYVYLFLLIIKEIKFNRKTHMILLFLSLLSTVVPYYVLFYPFENIRIVSKFLTYVTGSNGFWDFAGLSRLFFVALILFFYERFSKDDYIKMLADVNLVGFAMYYVLKTSEITASRVHIFSFVLIIPLFIYLIKELQKTKILAKLALIGLFSFSVLYLEKNLIATQRETGFASVNYIYDLVLFNQVEYEDYYQYDNQYAVLAYNSGYCRDVKSITNPLQMPVEQEGYMVVRDSDTRLYGIIDQTGDWAVEPFYHEKPELIGKTVVSQSFDLRETYFTFQQKELSKKPWDANEYIILQNRINTELPKVIPTVIDGYEEDLEKFFINLDKIQDLALKEYKHPFEFKTLSLTYSNNHYHLFLDENLEIQNNLVFTDEIRFDANGLSSAKTFCGYVVLNSNGDIIYKE